MALRQREWARRTRAALIVTLGSKCARCSTAGSKRNALELDCIAARGYAHHRMEWSQRISFYRREHREGNLQILCRRCNAVKGNADDMAALRASWESD
jgi:5-methylcytosine-specific restriction endonuclease McrA